MNHLQKYLALKGITARQIEQATGLGYHAIQKTIKGLRKGRVARQAIADYLGLPYTHVWGAAAARHLNKLMPKAIEDRAQQSAHAERRRLQQQYLDGRLAGFQLASNG
jgi:hypothetical protein